MARLTIPDEQTYATFTATAQTVFPITFALLSGKPDLRVSVDDVELLQSDFTFSGTLLEGGGYQGGTVTLNSAVSGEVLIWRDVTTERASQFAPSNTVPVRSVDMAFNRAMAIAQDLVRDLGQAVRSTLGRPVPSAQDVIDAATFIATRMLVNFSNGMIKHLGLGSVNIPALSWFSRFYFPEDFGAVGDDAHDDGPAFQACIDAMLARGGGRMMLSPGKAYLLFNTAVVDMSAVTLLYGDRFEIVGTASTTVRSALTNAPLFDVIGGAWGTLGAAPNVLFSSFVIRGGDPRPSIGRTGVRLTRCVAFTFDRMVFMENHQDVKLIDTLAGKFTTCSFNFSNRGVDGEASTADPNGGSSPNEIVFDDCHWINIRNRPVRLDNASQATFTGSSFEGTGQPLSSITDDGPVYSIEMPRAGTYGNAALNMSGTHFENCRGEAHFRFVQGIEAATYNISGTDWTNQSSTNYVNHVVSFVRGTGQAYFNFKGVGHNYSGGYVPSSSRNFWDQTGTGLDAICNDLGGSHWGIPTERPYFAGRIYQEQVTGGSRQTAAAPSPGLVALETGHATSRRAAIAIGSGWVLGQDFDTNGQKTLYLLNLNAGALNTIPLFIEQNGRLRLPGLPTSAAGLSSGTLWNDAGTVKVV